jgi:hypothetical protein
MQRSYGYFRHWPGFKQDSSAPVTDVWFTIALKNLSAHPFLPLLLALLMFPVSDGFALSPGDPAPKKKALPQILAPPVISESAAARQTTGVNRQKDPQVRLAAVPLLNEQQAQTLDRESTQGDDMPLLDEQAEKKLDEFQQKGSEIVISAAEWIDSFFDDPRYLAEENRTRLKVKLGLGYSKYYDLETYSAIDLRVHLPRLENKANFFLRLNDDSDFDADSSPIPNTEGGRKNDQERASAGFQYFLAMGEKYNISTEVGVSLDYLYGGLRYRHLHSLFNDDWSGRFTNRLRYYTDDGWENKASYDIERFFGERFLYRNIFTAVFSEAEEGVPFSAITRLYQVLDIDTALSYEAGGYFNTEPEPEVTDVQLKVRYRQRFYRDWLVLEVAPQITFPSEYDHAFNPGIVTRFEFDFGYLSDHKAFDSVFKF